MLIKKTKSVSVSTSDAGVSPEVTKPRARAKSSTNKLSVAEPAVMPALKVRHASVSSRKLVKAAEPVAPSMSNISPIVTTADVATRAYHIWMETGCPQGNELENWTRAEHELRSMAVGQ